jgi:hypothetical protein
MTFLLVAGYRSRRKWILALDKYLAIIFYGHSRT